MRLAWGHGGWIVRSIRYRAVRIVLQYRLDNWHTTMFILGVISMAMVPLAFGLREQRDATVKQGAAIPQGTKDALQEAFRTQSFWLLTIGFFVCGFHVTFIGLHLPSYISDKAHIGLVEVRR